MNRTILAITILSACTASVARCGAAEVHLVGYSEPEWKERHEERENMNRTTVHTPEALTAELARSLWEYDSETGTLTWKTKTCRKVCVGEVAGSVSLGYLCVKHKGIRYRAHRLAWLITTGEWPVNEIDHINGDRSDNRMVNLREASRQENNLNRKCHREGKLRYATWIKLEGKWQARAPRINGKREYLGLYSTMEAANAAAEQWIKENLTEE